MDAPSVRCPCAVAVVPRGRRCREPSASSDDLSRTCARERHLLVSHGHPGTAPARRQAARQRDPEAARSRLRPPPGRLLHRPPPAAAPGQPAYRRQLPGHLPPAGPLHPFILEVCRRQDPQLGLGYVSLVCRRWRKPPQRQASDPSPRQRGEVASGALQGPRGGDGSDRFPLGFQVRAVAWSARRSNSCATSTEAWV